MTKTMTMLLIALPALSGCQGALWGNLVVLGITFGIFFGTLNLTRSSDATRSEASTTARRS